MYRSKCVFTLLTLSLASGAFGQTTTPQDPAAAPPPAPAASDPWSVGRVQFSGLVDAYYSLNTNHPASRNNVIRNFDVKANQLTLNMAKLSLEHAPAPLGFKLDLGFGRAFEVFHATEPGGLDVYRNIFQAYASVRPEGMGGLQLDFGKFATSAGAEPTETHLNWNYSRSLLYANGPYYHFGLRTTKPIGEHFTAGFQLLNGWNNVEDNNSGKTVGFTSAVTSSKFNWFNNYYVGPEKTNINEGYRHFYDTVFAINPTDRVNFLLNFDYGIDRGIGGLPGNKFYGYSTAMRFLANETFAISPRYDWYKDQDGFITGQAQTLQEFTLTGDLKMKEGFLTRLEYRRDWSNQPFFDRGNELASSKSQNTFLIGFVVFFGPTQ